MRGVLPQSVLDDIEQSGYAPAWEAIYSPGEIEDLNRNSERYRQQRGRVCEYPGCEAKIRYTRTIPCCVKHEDTEFAACLPQAEPGAARAPRLYGLRAARIKGGLGTQEIARVCGRSHKWAQQAERPRNGVPKEIRALLAITLNVSEAELLEGGINVA